jgi:predicted RND superfamily exporter protein
VDPVVDAQVFAAGATLAIATGVGIAALRPAWIVGHPRSVLAILAVITVGAAFSLVRTDPLGLRIEVDSSTEPMLPRNDPGRDDYAAAVRAFGTDDIYVIALESEDAFSRESLETLKRVTKSIRAIRGIRSVESLVDVPHFAYDAENDWVEVRRFINEIPEELEGLHDLRHRALADPIYPRTIVSRDGRTAAINVSFMPMTDGEFVDRDIDGLIWRILELEAGEDQRFYVTGRPHIRSEAHHMLVRDILQLIPLAIAVAVVLLFLMTGSVRGTLVPLASNLTSTFWTFGAMAAIGLNLTLITLVLGPMLICVGCVYGVHVLARYEVIAEESPDAASAALRSLEYTRVPVLLAGITTVIGFAALLISNIPATNELGMLAIFGVACVTLLSLTGVPAALALMPLHGADGRPLFGNRTKLATHIDARFTRLLVGLSRVVVRRPGSMLIGWGALSVVAVALMPLTVTDTDLIKYFLEDSRVRRDFNAVNELLTGAVPIYVVVEGSEEGAFREPSALRAIAATQRALEAQRGVSSVLSVADFVQVVQAALDGKTLADGRIPATRQAVAEAVFMVPKDKMRRFTTSNHSSANLVVRTGELGSAAMRDLERRILETLEQSGLANSFRVAVTGNTILLNHGADGIAGNQATQVALAAITMLLLVSRVFRSLRLGLVAMVPNFVPVLLFFGALGLGAAPLSVPTSLIGCIALGIAVDDTVHFLVSYQGYRVRGSSPRQAAHRTILSVGRPIVMTSIMLVAGFFVITLSGFATLREFGYLTAMTMAICLSTDLALLPALLVRSRA